jgi:putative oxidoreductase
MTASLFHTNFASQNELLHFEKDLAIAGGMFILALAGSGRLSLDRVLAGLVKDTKIDPPIEQHLSVGETSLPV